jgi:hypothetical protein
LSPVMALVVVPPGVVPGGGAVASLTREKAAVGLKPTTDASTT